MARFSLNRTFSGRKPYILFLCTGNTCRSPMAYGILNKFFEEMEYNEVEVRTAGVMTIPGLVPTQESRQILLKDDIDVGSHRSRKMTPELLRRANLVLGMTSFHVQMALRMSDDARGKTFLLKEYVGLDGKNSQIQDPMGCTLEVYKKVYRDLRKACKRLAKMDLVTPGPPASALKRKAALAKKKSTKAAALKSAAPDETPPKPAAKKAPAKKAAEKKTETKAKSPATKPAKKAATKPAAAPAAKKTAAKAPAEKKATPTAKKAASEKGVPKKPAAKKSPETTESASSSSKRKKKT